MENSYANKSLNEIFEEHNKALENINLAVNRILNQQEQIITFLASLTSSKVEENTEPQSYDGFTN